MIKKFRWTCKRSWGVIQSINIFLDEKPYGQIPGLDYWRPRTATINGQRFLLERSGFLGMRVYVIDPKDKKAYCEIHYEGYDNFSLLSPAFEYIYNDNSEAIFSGKDKKKILRITFDKYRFFQPTEGAIIIDQEDKNESLLVFCLFYFFTRSNKGE